MSPFSMDESFAVLQYSCSLLRSRTSILTLEKLKVLMKQTCKFTGNLDADGKLKWAILMNRKDFAKIAIETANTPNQVRWSHLFIFIVLFSVCEFLVDFFQ